MPVGRVTGGDMSGLRRNAPGKIGPLTLGDAALRAAAKAGVGKSGIKEAKRKANQQEQQYAIAMRDIKSRNPTKPSGKTAAVSAKSKPKARKQLAKK